MVEKGDVQHCFGGNNKNPMMHKVSYAILQECCFLLSYCKGRATKGSLSFLGDKSILLKDGSKVFMHCDKDGRVITAVVFPIDGHLSLPLDTLSAMGKSKYDLHLMNSNCKLKL
jgi:hypothetical protein